MAVSMLVMAYVIFAVWQQRRAVGARAMFVLIVATLVWTLGFF